MSQPPRRWPSVEAKREAEQRAIAYVIASATKKAQQERACSPKA